MQLYLIKLLSMQQRLLAIFLLIQSFKNDGFKRNPFATTILYISQNTYEAYERIMIADLILDSNRQKYSKNKIQVLFDEEQLMIDPIEQRQQIGKLRNQILNNLPNIPQTKKSQVYNTINDGFDYRGKKIGPPQIQISYLQNKLFQNGVFTSNTGSLMPIPSFVDISPSQFNWLSPGIIADVHWDNSADLQKKFAKVRASIKKGIQTKLQKQQAAQIQRTLQNQAYAVLNLDISVDNLNLLIKHNPFVAISFLAKIAAYPIIGDYLQAILQAQVSMNSIDVLFRLIKTTKIPPQFIEVFTLKSIKQMMSFPDNFKQRSKIVRVMCGFIRTLVKNKLLVLDNFIEDVKQFINYFEMIQEAKTLKTYLTE